MRGFCDKGRMHDLVSHDAGANHPGKSRGFDGSSFVRGDEGNGNLRRSIRAASIHVTA